MKKVYSIGYIDKYGDFTKVWENGETRKFATIEECKKYLDKNKEAYKECKKIRIMQGWKTIEEIKESE